MKRESGIYAIVNIKDGENTTYVGQSVNLAERMQTHRRMLNHGTHSCKHLQHAWNVYGEHSFQFIVLETVLQRTSLTEREQWWLDNIKSERPVYNSGIIVDTPSFMVTRRWTDIKKTLKTSPIRHEQKPSKTIRRIKISLAMKGRKPSPITLAAVSIANKLYPHRSHFYPELINIRTGQRIPSGKNCAKFSREHGLSNSGFCRMLKGGLPHANGWMPMERYLQLSQEELNTALSDRRCNGM